MTATSAMRGFSAWPAGVTNPIGPGIRWCVRSTACTDCCAWAEALRGLATQAVYYGSDDTHGEIVAHHTSPNAENEPVVGDLCAACKRERAWFVQHGLIQPTPEAVTRAFLGTLLAKRRATAA